MKRDMNLIRRLLLTIESKNQVIEKIIEDSDDIDGVKGAVLLFHIRLLIDAGFINGRILDTLCGGSVVTISRLTYQGCDFLDSIRDDTIWEKFKVNLKEKWPEIAVEGVSKIFKFL